MSTDTRERHERDARDAMDELRREIRKLHDYTGELLESLVLDPEDTSTITNCAENTASHAVRIQTIAARYKVAVVLAKFLRG